MAIKTNKMAEVREKHAYMVWIKRRKNNCHVNKWPLTHFHHGRWLEWKFTFQGWSHERVLVALLVLGYNRL